MISSITSSSPYASLFQTQAASSQSNSLAQVLAQLESEDDSTTSTSSPFTTPTASTTTSSPVTGSLSASGSNTLSSSTLLQLLGAPPSQSPPPSDGNSAIDALKALLQNASPTADAGQSTPSTAAATDPATKIQQLFQSLDTNGDGTLSKTELEQAVTKAGGTTASADALFSQLDPNNTGSVSEQQFADNTPKPQGAHHSHHGHHGHGGGIDSTDSTDTTDSTDQNDPLLSFFDTNGDGSVSSSELSQGFAQLRTQTLGFLISGQNVNQGLAATA